MAITFNSVPSNYSTSDNPLTFVFSSDQTAQSNFYFKVQTLLGATVVSEDFVFVEVGTRAHIDVSPVISKLLNLPRITSAISTGMDIIDTVSVRVTEFYGDPATSQATNTSSSVKVFKACLGSEQWEDTSFLIDYVDSKWLTDAPNNTVRIIRGADVIAAMLTNSTTSLSVIFYDSSGSVLDIYTGSLVSYDYYQVNFNSDLLSAVYGGGSYSDVAYFTAQIGGSELLTFVYVDEYCNGIHSLLWLNKYGTFDQYPIEHNVSSKTDIESRSYKKKYGAWVGLKYEYDRNSSGNVDFEKVMTDRGTLVTNYMTDTVQNWFVSAYESPECYLYSPSGIMFLAKITSRSYDVKNGRFDELIMEELNYEKTTSRKSVTL